MDFIPHKFWIPGLLPFEEHGQITILCSGSRSPVCLTKTSNLVFTKLKVSSQFGIEVLINWVRFTPTEKDEGNSWWHSVIFKWSVLFPSMLAANWDEVMRKEAQVLLWRIERHWVTDEKQQTEGCICSWVSASSWGWAPSLHRRTREEGVVDVTMHFCVCDRQLSWCPLLLVVWYLVRK